MAVEHALAVAVLSCPDGQGRFFDALCSDDLQLDSLEVLSTCSSLRSVLGSSGALAQIYKSSLYSHGRKIEVQVRKYHLETGGADKARKHVAREVTMWKELHHPNVLPVLGMWTDPGSHKPCVVSPWMHNGNVREYTSQKTMDYSDLMAGIGRGLAYLHSCGIIHGDLKPNAILIDGSGIPMLSEFGKSCYLKDIPELSASGVVPHGTIAWMAPERLLPRPTLLSSWSYMTPASDVYALGMTIYEIVSQRRPWEGRLAYEAMMAVLDGERPSHPGGDAHARGLTPSLWSFIERCWAQLPSARPAAAELDSVLGMTSAQNEIGE